MSDTQLISVEMRHANQHSAENPRSLVERGESNLPAFPNAGVAPGNRSPRSCCHVSAGFFRALLRCSACGTQLRILFEGELWCPVCNLYPSAGARPQKEAA